jgi:hypothetical protein
MKEENKNFYIWLCIFGCPIFLAIFFGGVLEIEEAKLLILGSPLGCALFHFRGKVWWKHWYSKSECVIWGIGWLIVFYCMLQKWIP